MLTFKQFPPSRLWTIKRSKADLLFPSLKRRLLYKKSRVFPFVEEEAIEERYVLLKLTILSAQQSFLLGLSLEYLSYKSIGNYIFLVCPFYFEYFREGLIFKCDSMLLLLLLDVITINQKFLA